jgi:hypothetical protein
MTTHKLTRLYTNLKGERGLLLAVMAMAYRDLNYGDDKLRQDAQDYFAGDVFKDHLDLLDLPSDFTPA